MNTNGEEQEVKKKKKIIAVYNTHNSKTGIKDPRAEKKQQAASDDSERSRKGGYGIAAEGEVMKRPGRDCVQGYGSEIQLQRLVQRSPPEAQEHGGASEAQVAR